MEAEHRCTVLVVDDDAGIRESLARALRLENHQVVQAADGLLGLDHLRRNPAPCSILLDLMMPNMDGREFASEQKKDPALAAIPVIVMSAYGQSVANRKSLPAFAYLEKPVELQPLLDCIASACPFKRPE